LQSLFHSLYEGRKGKRAFNQPNPSPFSLKMLTIREKLRWEKNIPGMGCFRKKDVFGLFEAVLLAVLNFSKTAKKLKNKIG